MADFSDRDDRALYQLVLPFAKRQQAIDWPQITKAMKFSKKTQSALRERLKTLKKTHGNDVSKFPRYFHRPIMLRLSPPPYAIVDIYRLINSIFASVSKGDVRQASGERSRNAGEIAMQGVTELLACLRMGLTDRFCDVGSGIGNIVAQVVLQSPVVRCFGIEIRPELASLSQGLIVKHVGAHPRLANIQIINGDVRNPTAAAI